MKYLNLLFVAVGTVLAILVILTIPCLMVLPLPQRQRNHIINPLWKLFGIVITKYVLRTNPLIEDLRTKEEKDLAVPVGLYVSNHLGMVDIPLILSTFQAPPIMKKEILRIPIFGLIGVASGAIPLDRKDPDARKKVFAMAQARLVQGLGMQVYPEGTRSRTGRPKDYSEIKPALTKFCYEKNIPVYPVSLWGTNQIFDKKNWCKTGVKVGMIVHPQMKQKDFKNADEFALAVWNKIIEGYNTLEKKLG